MTSFSDLGLSSVVVESLAKLGFEEPTPIQQEAIPALLTGRDVLGQAATGTGKTAAFSLPLIERWLLDTPPSAPIVLIITPTRELCLQVSEAFHGFGRDAGIVVTPIYGGQDYGRQIRALKRGTHVVVATPGRALDHISRGTLNLSSVKAVVLDEADEMLDLGFADELDSIFDALPEKVQKALFSATLPPRIARIAEDRLDSPIRIAIAKEATPEGEAPLVPQIAYVVGKSYRIAALGRILDLEAPELAIIFARTRNEVDDLTEALRARGYSVEALHGGLDQPTRDRVMRRARSGQVDAIVATDVAARGIDLENLTHVINFGIPASYETYVHRIGRTGRAGRSGTAITILEPREHRHLRMLEKITKAKIEIRSVPSATDVRAKRLELLRGALEEILEGEDRNALERFRVVVESLCEEHDPFDVAAAALKLAQENDGGEDDDAEIPAFADRRRERPERANKVDRMKRDRRETPEHGMTRIFIGIGRFAGIRPGDIVGAIANEAGISSKAIGAIDISDRFSIAEVEGDLAETVVASLQGARVKGRPVTVKLDGTRTPRREENRSRDYEYAGKDRRIDHVEKNDRFDRFDRHEQTDRRPRAERRGPRR